MSATYSGSLQMKKKTELQEIAQALAINDSGTREVLQHRIKKYLDVNSAELENDPAFAGLYMTRGGRRQRNLQSSTLPAQTTRSLGAEPKFLPVAEEETVTPPVDDFGNASIPQSSQTPSSSPRSSARKAPISPRNAPLPPSSSPAGTLVSRNTEQPEVKSDSESSSNFVAKVFLAVSAIRTFLSSSRNIFFVSTLLDFLSILYQIHINSVIPIPPIYVSVEPALSTTLLASVYWAIPSIVIPAIVGYLVSFSPSPSQGRVDVLSASIIRAAANVSNVYPSILTVDKKGAPRSLDILGPKWRAVSSGVTVAFAFAEAIVRRNVV